MPQKIKEEERIERIIRGLLKLTDNRRCINCNSLGPQYACTTFWTFVCTNCSGVHREFTHRVKSVSIAKFTADEIAALQAGGNERAKQIYFKTWDPHRNSYPDCCNLHALRTFIKHVYLDRKFSGEKKNDYPSVDKPIVKDDYAEKFRVKPREDFFERRYPERNDSHERRSYEKSGSNTNSDGGVIRSLSYYIEERNSPRDKQENLRSSFSSSSRRKSRGATFEIVDDRFRDHDEITTKHYGSSSNLRLANHDESRARSSSPVLVESRRASSSNPRLLPLKDFLGNNSPRLQVGEPVKGKASSTADAANIKNEGSRGGNGKQEENKKKQVVITHSLIDFDADFDSGPIPQTAPSVPTTGQVFNPMDSLFLDMEDPVTTTTTTPADTNTSSKAMEPSQGAHYQTSSSGPVTNELSGQSSQPVTDIVQVNNSGNGQDYSGRRELPMDLFASFGDGAGPPSWQYNQPYGVGYNIQQNHTAMIPQEPLRSRNPFDLSDSDPQQEQPTTLPSMPGISSSQYTPAVVPQGNPYGMMTPPGYMSGQHVPGSNITSGPQGGFKNPSNDDAFASLIPIQRGASCINFTQMPENPRFALENSHGASCIDFTQMPENQPFAPENSHPSTCGNPFG